MRILLLSWEFPPHIVGGLGKHVADLAPALADHGIDVHIVTPLLRGGSTVETVHPGVTVHRVPLDEHIQPDQSIVTFSQASNTVLQQKAQELYTNLGGFSLIHGHDWLVAYAGVALKHSLNLPLIVTVHSMERGRMQGHLGSDESRAIHGTEWWLTTESSRVITVSRYMAEQVHTFFNVPLEKLDIIYNGVTIPETVLMSQAEREAFRKTYAEPNEKILYYVGRLVHEKGIHVLIEAAPQILRQVPHTKFIIAGTGVMLDSLRAHAHARGVADHVIFTGFIADDIRDKLYQVADVAVFPSLYEPFGIVALEAMAFGCPVVVGETGGLAEVVKTHHTGILTRPGDPDSLAWGILHTLQQPEWAMLRALNAIHEVKDSYYWPRIAAQTIETYRRVTN